MSVEVERANPSGKAPGAAAKAEDYRVVCVRMRAAELEGFADEIERRKLTSSMALRIAARRIGGFLEIDAATRAQLETLVCSIGETSAAIRALHEAYVGDGVVSLSDLEAQRVGFGEQFAALDALLRTLLNVSWRREDGRRRLGEALL